MADGVLAYRVFDAQGEGDVLGLVVTVAVEDQDPGGQVGGHKDQEALSKLDGVAVRVLHGVAAHEKEGVVHGDVSHGEGGHGWECVGETRD